MKFFSFHLWLHKFHLHKEAESDFKIESYVTLIAKLQSELKVEKEITFKLNQKLDCADDQIKKPSSGKFPKK